VAVVPSKISKEQKEPLKSKGSVKGLIKVQCKYERTLAVVNHLSACI